MALQMCFEQGSGMASLQLRVALLNLFKDLKIARCNLAWSIDCAKPF